MPEFLTPQFPEIITGPEDLPQNITFEKLVETVGGKAAGLLWIQKHLPDIPTAKMITGVPQASDSTIIEAAKANGLKFPWIIRASSPADNLPGSEGQLISRIVNERDYIVEELEDVRRYKTWAFRTRFGEQKISVNVAEYSASNLAGTIVAHPHQEGIYLANVSEISRPINRKYAVFFIRQNKLLRVERFSTHGSEIYISKTIEANLGELQSIYQRITSILEFSGEMTYQLEFGLNPFLLYQIRDFLPKTKAGFALEGADDNEDADLLVFGITPEEGVKAKIYEYGHSEWSPKNKNIAVIGKRDELNELDFPRIANLFYYSRGLLSHQEVCQIRTTPLNIFNSGSYLFKSNDKVRIISDGVRVKITKP